MLGHINTKTFLKSLLLTGVGVVLFAQVQLFAAKGDSKTKKGIVLKFSGFDLKGIGSSFLTFRPSIVLKSNTLEKAPQQTSLQSVLTYQQGNTIFILPYKHKVILPKFKTPEAPKF
jgi:hypothetical protein